MNNPETRYSARAELDFALSELLTRTERAEIPPRLRELAERLEMALAENRKAEHSLE